MCKLKGPANCFGFIRLVFRSGPDAIEIPTCGGICKRVAGCLQVSKLRVQHFKSVGLCVCVSLIVFACTVMNGETALRSLKGSQVRSPHMKRKLFMECWLLKSEPPQEDLEYE